MTDQSEEVPYPTYHEIVEPLQPDDNDTPQQAKLKTWQRRKFRGIGYAILRGYRSSTLTRRIPCELTWVSDLEATDYLDNAVFIARYIEDHPNLAWVEDVVPFMKRVLRH